MIPTLLVSPADGRVVMIKDVAEDKHIGGEATRVSIFLSLFDVHVNRSPFKAQVCWMEHRAGEFKNAAFADASEVNERNTIALQAGSTKLLCARSLDWWRGVLYAGRSRLKQWSVVSDSG